MEIILDRDNWDLGQRDDSNPLSPFYHKGGFASDKEFYQTRKKQMQASKLKASKLNAYLHFVVSIIYNF